MPHEQSFLSSVLSVWEDQLTVMRLFFSLVHPLLRASGKDKTMKRIPKTPIEFDYDLWISEDGKCMVRVKDTGETTEVDREVMKALRNEEKKLRRSYDTGGASDSEDSEETQPSTVLSLDAVPEDDVKASAWLESPEKMEEDIITGLLEQEFIRSLTKPQLDVYMNCMRGNMSMLSYAQYLENRISSAADLSSFLEATCLLPPRPSSRKRAISREAKLPCGAAVRHDGEVGYNDTSVPGLPGAARSVPRRGESPMIPINRW